MNCWWNIVFFGSITSSPFLISIGCVVLLFASILMWPLGMKIIRNAKRRINTAKKVAQGHLARQEHGGIRHAYHVSPVVESEPGRDLVPYQRQ